MLLAAALALAAAPAAPSPEDLTADIRCLVVSLAIASNPDFASVGLVSSFYWIGRVQLRMSEAELESAITAEFLKMTAADMKLEGARCGAEMARMGKAMERIGAGLTRRGERLDTH